MIEEVENQRVELTRLKVMFENFPFGFSKA